MKAKRKKSETFDFDINGKTYHGFKRESEWEGFAKYKNHQGVIIVAEEFPPFETMMSMLAPGAGYEEVQMIRRCQIGLRMCDFKRKTK